MVYRRLTSSWVTARLTDPLAVLVCAAGTLDPLHGRSSPSALDQGHRRATSCARSAAYTGLGGPGQVPTRVVAPNGPPEPNGLRIGSRQSAPKGHARRTRTYRPLPATQPC